MFSMLMLMFMMLMLISLHEELYKGGQSGDVFHGGQSAVLHFWRQKRLVGNLLRHRQRPLDIPQTPGKVLVGGGSGVVRERPNVTPEIHRIPRQTLHHCTFITVH